METSSNLVENTIQLLSQDMSDSIFVSLLLLRQISLEKSLSPLISESGTDLPGASLWETLRSHREGSCLDALSSALRLLEPVFPFVGQLISQNQLASVEEPLLRRLVDLLTDCSPEDVTCAQLFERHMQRKVPVHTRQYQGDYYTPRAVAQCLASLLDPCQGSVYDPCCGSGALLWAAQQQGKGQLKLYGQTQDQRWLFGVPPRSNANFA